ncbi:SHOCT domain-containing protein [Actinophytocola sp.]|uniref:SHOCT domain-containing protein n=1 Tax=Actinophytocola sp. TaxID=1872138 RepID=UPI002D802D8E|nr:SHOCT domain-containing protein [Actinophytocola sp.]HET9143493.1 SHOCT domain-containing protein [Actinophytocola sp.]
MSWQEELRKLDEELAAGQISADEYRVRRDQVLASAVSAGPESSTTPPGTAAAAPPGPQQPAAQPPAAQPPARPGEPARGGDDADRTQIVPNEGERTQAVSGGWQAARPGGQEADRTQAVPGVPPQAYAGGAAPRSAPGVGQFPPPPGYQQGWHDEAGPPWSGAEFPPLAHSNPDWIRQGPEVFEAGDRSKAGKIALIVVAVLLVAGLSVGAVILLNRDDSQAQPSNPQTTAQTPPTTTTSARPKDDLEVADLPGKHESTNHIKTFADVLEAKMLTPEEGGLYEQAGADKVRMVSTVMPNGTHAFVLTTAVKSPAEAIPVRDSLSQLQITYGMQAHADAPNGVKAAGIGKLGDRPATIRAHYVHKGTVVRVQVYGDSQADVNAAFRDVISLQADALAVDQ